MIWLSFGNGVSFVVVGGTRSARLWRRVPGSHARSREMFRGWRDTRLSVRYGEVGGAQ